MCDLRFKSINVPSQLRLDQAFSQTPKDSSYALVPRHQLPIGMSLRCVQTFEYR